MLLQLNYVWVPLILNIRICLSNANNERTEEFRSLYNFVIDLENSSTTFLDYVTKVQAIFCPKQPICSDEGEKLRENILADLPPFLSTGNATINVENIPEFARICCFPCSCEETCEEDDNCCLSKGLTRRTETAKQAKSKCIVASLKGYHNSILNKNYARYYMITQCFEDTSNITLISKCENPDKRDLAGNIPVTSVKTKRIYWNKNCAYCNKDADDLLYWNIAVKFIHDFIFYSSTPTLTAAFSMTVEEMLYKLVKSGDLVYLPPIPMTQKRCIEKKHLITCDGVFTTLKAQRLLKERCEAIYQPMIIEYTNPLPVFNIFCLFCLETNLPNTATTRTTDCLGTILKADYSSQMMALLDYNPLTSFEGKRWVQTQSSIYICPCDKIYDPYLGNCRPVFCPMGEFLINCKCVQPLQKISGMPVLVKLRLVPEEDSKTIFEQEKTVNDADETVTTRLKDIQKVIEAELTQVHNKLKKMLQGDITADPFATFIDDKKTQPLLLSLVIVRSRWGYDTKETVKPLMDYLDSGKSLSFRKGKMAYLVNLTNRVLVWHENYTFIPKVKTLNKDGNELKLVYLNDRLMQSTLSKGYYQILSPLLYCKQVELNDSECFEKDGAIVVNVTRKTFTTSEFYRTSPVTVRVCLDEYLLFSGTSVATHHCERYETLIVFLYFFIHIVK